MIEIILAALAIGLAFLLFWPQPETFAETRMNVQRAKVQSTKIHRHWTDEKGERRCTLFGKPWGCRRVRRG